MTSESDSIRQQQWVLAVLRTFGIPDMMSNDDARRALVGSLEEQLQENGWLSATRAVADPMAEALLAFGATSDLDDLLSSTDLPAEAAHRLISNGMTVVDPEHLALDVRGEYPPEVVVVAQLILVRAMQCVREHPYGA
jgi:hypothetical protein